MTIPGKIGLAFMMIVLTAPLLNLAYKYSEMSGGMSGYLFLVWVAGCTLLILGDKKEKTDDE